MHTFRVMAALAAAAAVGAGCGATDDSRGRASAPAEAIAALPAQPGRMVTVPRIVGRDRLSARRLAESRGLGLRVVAYSGALGNPRIPRDCTIVTSQSPPAGMRKARGQKIGVTFGNCPDAIAHGKRGTQDGGRYRD
jgi:beta-lactam-binding protein with PASTA domain